MDDANHIDTWRRRGRQAAEKVGFALPDGITMVRGRASDGMVFYVRHRELGELGRVRLLDDGRGHSRLLGEVAGDEADPLTAKRAELLAPLVEELHHVLDVAAGVVHTPGPALPTPRAMLEEPCGVLPVKLMFCERCGTPVARLIFAPTGTQQRGEFEDVARLTFGLCAKQPLPTWIIGPGNLSDAITGCDPTAIRSTVMPVWPEHGELFESSPSLFNQTIETLQANHCASKAARRGPRRGFDQT